MPAWCLNFNIKLLLATEEMYSHISRNDLDSRICLLLSVNL